MNLILLGNHFSLRKYARTLIGHYVKTVANHTISIWHTQKVGSRYFIVFNLPQIPPGVYCPFQLFR